MPKTIENRSFDQTLTDLDETADLPLLASVATKPPGGVLTPARDDEATALDLLRQLLEHARSIDARLDAISQALTAPNKGRR